MPLCRRALKPVLLLLALLAASACPVPAPAAPPAAHAAVAREGADLAALVRRYTRDRRALESFYWIGLAPARRARLAEFDEEWRARLVELLYAELDAEARLDFHLLRSALDGSAAARALAEQRQAEMAPLLPFLDELVGLEEERWRIAPLEPRAAAALLAGVAEEAKNVKQRVRLADGEAADKDEAGEGSDDAQAAVLPGSDAPTPAAERLEIGAVLALRTAKALDELGEVLSTWYEHHAGYRPEFAWWVEQPKEAARKALEDLAQHLRRELAGLKGEDDDPLIGDPIGRAALELALAEELIAYSPEELLAIGERELAWCEAELAAAAREMGESDWRVALERVKEAFVPPGEQDALVVRQAEEVIRFLDERELVTVEVLCRETWRVDMLSRQGQQVLPFAAYGGQKILVAYPTVEMDHGEKLMALRGNNEHFTRIVTPHELIPGHHLQAYMSARYAEHRQVFSTPFYVEGWALSWEMLLWDLDYARGPEDRIGMLFWRMHRCARILVSLRFHLGEMRPTEMVDFLVERVGHERENATGEVRRYVGDDYGPLYQCAYMIGGLQLRALRREFVDERGGSLRDLHDGVLRSGPIPIELVRARLLELELPPDWRPTWRFAD